MSACLPGSSIWNVRCWTDVVGLKVIFFCLFMDWLSLSFDVLSVRKICGKPSLFRMASIRTSLKVHRWACVTSCHRLIGARRKCYRSKHAHQGCKIPGPWSWDAGCRLAGLYSISKLLAYSSKYKFTWETTVCGGAWFQGMNLLLVMSWAGRSGMSFIISKGQLGALRWWLLAVRIYCRKVKIHNERFLNMTASEGNEGWVLTLVRTWYQGLATLIHTPALPLGTFLAEHL